MPYFCMRMPHHAHALLLVSCIHLYESLGWWRAAAELRKIHFAEVSGGRLGLPRAH